MVNKAFEEETKTLVKNPEEGTVRILKYKIDDTRLAAAITGVFAGDTFFIEDLGNPFSMFSGITRQNAPQSERFNKVVIFPVSNDDVKITHGVIAFMP